MVITSKQKLAILTKLIQHLSLALLLLGMTGVALTTDSTNVSDHAIAGVEGFHEDLLKSMRGTQMSHQQRYNMLHQAMQVLFDFRLISRLILGQNWRTLEKAEQEKFQDLLTQLSVATYASRFNTYNGETFETVGEKEISPKKKLVNTRLNRPKNEPISLDYLLHKDKQGWKIIGVIASGINDLALKRTEYSRIIKKHGINTLFHELSEKITSISP